MKQIEAPFDLFAHEEQTMNRQRAPLKLNEKLRRGIERKLKLNSEGEAVASCRSLKLDRKVKEK